MQATRSLFIGAGLGALISMAAIGAAVAQQSADSTPPVKPSKPKSAKPPGDSSKATAKELQMLHDQVDALQRRLDAQTAAQQQTQARADLAVAQAAAAKAQAATASAADNPLGFLREIGFLGAAQAANLNETNSYTPRIRPLYSQVDWNSIGLHLLAGQSWSLVTMQGQGITPRAEDIPLTIDAQYVPGFSFTRQPQIRLTEEFDQTFWLALSLENRETTA